MASNAPVIVIQEYNLLNADETFYERWEDEETQKPTSIRFANIPMSVALYVQLDPDFDFS